MGTPLLMLLIKRTTVPSRNKNSSVKEPSGNVKVVREFVAANYVLATRSDLFRVACIDLFTWFAYVLGVLS